MTTQDMTNNITQVAGVSQEIATDMTTVSEGSTEVEANSDQLKTHAEDLTDLGRKLHQMVGKFKLTPDA